MLSNLLPRFKVVEINNVAALRMGHVIAQIPGYAASSTQVASAYQLPTKTVGTYKFIENGAIVGVDALGVLAPFDSSRHKQPCLVYTEELDTAGLLSGLDQFATPVEGVDVPVYVRALPLNVGDTFTTDNYSGTASADGFAKVVAGVITYEATVSDDSMFIAKVSNLPAGQKALELTYIGFGLDLA